MARGWAMAAAWVLIGAVVIWAAGATFDRYVQTLIITAGINVILVVSLNLTNGLTGLFSLGHPAFMMIGGYIAAILTFPANRKGFMLPDLPPWLASAEWAFLPALLAGGFGAALVALVIGFPVLRLRGHYLAVATLGLIIIVSVLVRNFDGVTRGALGLSGIPRLTDLWWVYGWVVATVWVCWRLKHGSLGRAMLALSHNELAAASVGVRAARTKMLAFALGAFFAGVAGGLFAHQVTNLTPTSVGILTAFNLVVMVVVGGPGSLTGAILAALALSGLVAVMRPVEQATGAYGITQIVFAAILIVIMILRPQGLYGAREPAWATGRRGDGTAGAVASPDAAPTAKADPSTRRDTGRQ